VRPNGPPIYRCSRTRGALRRRFVVASISGCFQQGALRRAPTPTAGRNAHSSRPPRLSRTRPAPAQINLQPNLHRCIGQPSADILRSAETAFLCLCNAPKQIRMPDQHVSAITVPPERWPGRKRPIPARLEARFCTRWICGRRQQATTGANRSPERSLMLKVIQ
jgi:hypothetical protein